MTDTLSPEAESTYRVIERKGWSYVVATDGREVPDSGPWRYRWEAQEYADELNGRKP